MSESVRAASYAITNCASAERFAAAASLRLRATIERRLSSSALLGGNFVTHLSRSNFAQLIVAAQYK
jgi:hypothetical protein